MFTYTVNSKAWTALVLTRFENNNQDDWLLAHFLTSLEATGCQFGEQITMIQNR
jgi:hypothetical protein